MIFESTPPEAIAQIDCDVQTDNPIRRIGLDLYTTTHMTDRTIEMWQTRKLSSFLKRDEDGSIGLVSAIIAASDADYRSRNSSAESVRHTTAIQIGRHLNFINIGLSRHEEDPSDYIGGSTEIYGYSVGESMQYYEGDFWMPERLIGKPYSTLALIPLLSKQVADRTAHDLPENTLMRFPEFCVRSYVNGAPLSATDTVYVFNAVTAKTDS